MNYPRFLNLLELLKKKSFFLFGPRATGKTYLIKQQLEGTGSQPKAIVINLLKSNIFLKLSQNPSELEGIILAAIREGGDIPLVVVDEIQKTPLLLDEVHRLIEERGWRFLMTGSSARKIRRGHANLLAGRAWSASLFPLCSQEIPSFSLERYLRYGGLPVVYSSENPEEELDAYVQTYLKEEILAEGLIRKIPPFARFLKTAALSSGNILNFTEIGNDAQVSPSTVREYYSILEDTLIGFMMEPWGAGKKRKAVMTAKFYFFDTGVTHALSGTQTIDRNSNLYGNSFEQFMAMELRAYLSYHRIKETLGFWRTLQGHEVDFVLGDHTAIEVKATQKISSHHLRGLKALEEEGLFKRFYLVTHDPIETIKDHVTFIHWKKFLEKLWNNEIF